MTWYTFFKSVHVIMAVIWVGGAAMIQAYAFRILATSDGKRQADFAKDTEIVGMRVRSPRSSNRRAWLGIASVFAFYGRSEQRLPIPAMK